MAFTAEQIARAFAQSGGLVPSAGFNGSSVYDGIIAPSGNNAALAEIERSLANAPAERWAVDKNGQRIDPIGYVPTSGGAPVASTMPPVPRSRPASAPTRLDMAAINAPQDVTRVSGKMEQSNPLAGLFGGGGLLGLLTGPAKNGLPGLAGLLGGPQQGGLLQMLLSGGRQQPTTGGTAARGPAVTTVGRALGTNGYVYGLGSNGKYSQQGQSPALAGLTPSQQYSALTGGPGSVAAMELLHSGASRNPQSGGPAGGGEYGGGR